MRYLAVLMLVATYGFLFGCGKPAVCQTTDSYWSNCIGQKEYSDRWEEGIYEGAWMDNKPHGQGTFVEYEITQYGRTLGLQKYVGGWKEGLRHGTGIQYDSNGLPDHEGTWCDGIISGVPCHD